MTNLVPPPPLKIVRAPIEDSKSVPCSPCVVPDRRTPRNHAAKSPMPVGPLTPQMLAEMRHGSSGTQTAADLNRLVRSYSYPFFLPILPPSPTDPALPCHPTAPATNPSHHHLIPPSLRYLLSAGSGRDQEDVCANGHYHNHNHNGHGKGRKSVDYGIVARDERAADGTGIKYAVPADRSDVDPDKSPLIPSGSGQTPRLFRCMSEATTSANRRWRQLRVALLVVGRLMRPETQIVEDLGDIDKQTEKCGFSRQATYLTIDNYKQPTQTPFEEALKDHRQRERLFKATTKGVVGEWTEEYKKDPKRAIFDGTSHQSTVNAYSPHGYTQLYVAAQNGDTEMCRVLLEHGADPLLPSTAPGEPSELPLQCAARWGHGDCVEELIKAAQHPLAALHKAMAVASNPRTRQTLATHLQERRPKCCAIM
ncbi:unnamed protein product [Vitrella brassicaformis CCMP3155]|uniref:Uncharacterized protein n=1 Tax=Vitrella brassicaformis (strain CCMP3155) TaxID=1169540 RepID=A0A0G4ELG8_VITBC|nr:unnamed protein product [Vitrella brassicaformis CCMP3155]|eukprot:CEL97797.1 unnamed protein product [Vitrella brassicaformis CCMP3155]